MVVMCLVMCLVALVPNAASINSSGAGFASEIGNLNFANIIGGPLTAVVNAQAQAAATTVNFIESVGFTQADSDSPLELLTADFNYNTTINGTVVTRSMSVPFLYLVPIPFLQFDSVNLDFAVKLNSVDTGSTSNSQTSTQSFSGSIGFLFASVSMSGSVTTQQSTKTSVKVTRDYSLNIQVAGSQAAMPGGMQRMLDLFEAIIIQDNQQLQKGSK